MVSEADADAYIAKLKRHVRIWELAEAIMDRVGLIESKRLGSL